MTKQKWLPIINTTQHNTTQHNTTQHNTTQHNHNFFSVKDNFFIIDSEDLSNVTTKFYGFSVQESGIYDRHNLTDEAISGLDGNGVYVYIERSENEILIRQDFAGCYGLYLYNKDGRFVLSNSFLYLMEYMSRRVRLTMNRDYANHYLIMGLSSMAYSETFINEISLLPRDVNVRIYIPSVSITTERINYGENTVRLNSREGFEILDRWFAKWTGILKNVYEHTNNLEADLSGGFDSRMSFVLLINSGIDLRKVCVRSNIGKGYTLEEDYGIASEIAEHFGFTLNNTDNQTGGQLNYTSDDTLKIAFYSTMFAHIHLPKLTRKFEEKHYHLGGFWGETVRASLHPADISFMSGNTYEAKNFSGSVRQDLADSTEQILKHLLNEISINTNIPLSDELAPHVFRDTRGRSHFGTACALNFINNSYTLTPLVDTGLSRLRLDDENCKDKNLLMAVIYTRYCPDLLKFRFSKGETISPATVKFAEKISSNFPRVDAQHESRSFSIAPRDSEVSKLLADNNPPADNSALDNYSREIFNSTALRKLFATYFDEELYVYAEDYYKRTVWFPLAKCHTVIAAAEVIKHIIISEGTQERSITDDFREFAESEFVSITDKRTEGIIRRRLSRNRFAALLGKAVRNPRKAFQKIIKIITRK